MTQIEHLSLNVEFLRQQIYVTHTALCPNKIATWQGQAIQVGIAAKIARDLLDEAPCTCPNPDGSYPCDIKNEDCYRNRVQKRFFLFPLDQIKA